MRESAHRSPAFVMLRRVLIVAIWLAVPAASVLLACAGDGSSKRASAAGSAREAARVQRVVDGDTLHVRLADGRRQRVRLVGIDTPETKKPDTPVQCGGPQATAAMRRLVLDDDGHGVAVVLVRDRSQAALDRFGRRLAYVDLQSGRDVGLALVSAGWAQAREYDGRYAREDRYEAAERRARRAHRGVWELCAGR
jgi:micrococcal nuclease